MCRRRPELGVDLVFRDFLVRRGGVVTGQDAADVEIIGNAGDIEVDGEALDADSLMTLLNTNASIPLVASLLPIGPSSTEVAAGDHAHEQPDVAEPL